MLPDQRLAYKKQREATENLEIPPDLSKGEFNDALDVPAAGSSTFSEYAGERSKRREVATSGAILPDVKDVQLRRDGTSRWLEVSAPAEAVWPRVVSFWREQGILLVEQNPGRCHEDRLAREPCGDPAGLQPDDDEGGGGSRHVHRDQYRVPERPSGTTDIYLTHTAMVERLLSNTAGDTSGAGPQRPGKRRNAQRLMAIWVTERRAAVAVAEGACRTEGAARPPARRCRMARIGPDHLGGFGAPGVRPVWPGPNRHAVEDRDMSAGTICALRPRFRGRPEEGGILLQDGLLAR
jgi:outer membrane protein assembly factor BamC